MSGSACWFSVVLCCCLQTRVSAKTYCLLHRLDFVTWICLTWVDQRVGLLLCCPVVLKTPEVCWLHITFAKMMFVTVAVSAWALWFGYSIFSYRQKKTDIVVCLRLDSIRLELETAPITDSCGFNLGSGVSWWTVAVAFTVQWSTVDQETRPESLTLAGLEHDLTSCTCFWQLLPGPKRLQTFSTEAQHVFASQLL